MRSVLLSYGAMDHCSQILLWPEFGSFNRRGLGVSSSFFPAPKFTDEEKEAPEGEVPCPASHSQGVAELGANGHANSQDTVLSLKHGFATIPASPCRVRYLMSLPHTAWP